MRDQQDAGLTLKYLDHRATNLEVFIHYTPQYFIIPGMMKIKLSQLKYSVLYLGNTLPKNNL